MERIYAAKPSRNRNRHLGLSNPLRPHHHHHQFGRTQVGSPDPTHPQPHEIKIKLLNLSHFSTPAHRFEAPEASAPYGYPPSLTFVERSGRSSPNPSPGCTHTLNNFLIKIQIRVSSTNQQLGSLPHSTLKAMIVPLEI